MKPNWTRTNTLRYIWEFHSPVFTNGKKFQTWCSEMNKALWDYEPGWYHNITEMKNGKHFPVVYVSCCKNVFSDITGVNLLISRDRSYASYKHMHSCIHYFSYTRSHIQKQTDVRISMHLCIKVKVVLLFRLYQC